jgi:hypothetical protein
MAPITIDLPTLTLGMPSHLDPRLDLGKASPLARVKAQATQAHGSSISSDSSFDDGMSELRISEGGGEGGDSMFDLEM